MGVAQAAMLIAQHRYGPRCWIPRRYLPPRYDYFRVVLPAVLPGEDPPPSPGPTLVHPALCVASLSTGALLTWLCRASG